MLQARQHNDEPEKVVFYLPLNSEQELRMKRGVPVGVDWQNGMALITNDNTANRINVPFVYEGIITVRLRMKLNTLSIGFRYFLTLRDKNDAINNILARVENVTDVFNLSGSGIANTYLNGADYVSEVAEAGKWYEVVYVMTKKDYSRIALNIDGNYANNYSDILYDSLWVYNYALTAEEVANLYSG